MQLGGNTRTVTEADRSEDPLEVSILRKYVIDSQAD